MTGTTHKATAIALQNRRLVRISRKRGSWTAEITAAGEQWIASGGTMRLPSPAGARAATGPADTVPVHGAKPPRPPSVAPTEQLLADLLQAGGVVERERGHGKPDIEGLVRSAIRFGKVPPGRMLLTDPGQDWCHVTVRLEPIPADTPGTVAALTVPASLRKPHPAVAAAAATTAMSSSKIRGRAARLLQALVTAAGRGGYEIVTPPPGSRPPRLGRTDTISVTVIARRLAVHVLVRQQIERAKHEPTPAELTRLARRSWERLPQWDETPTDRLTVELDGGQTYAGSRWKDGKRHHLEDVLGEILHEIGMRAVLADRAHAARERAAEEQRRAWEAAVKRAKADLIESRRTDQLNRQLETWDNVRRIRAYITTMEAALVDLEGADADQAQAWIAWCSEYARRTDPLRALRLPPDPEPTPDALRPFLRGWSAYPPDR